MALQTPTHISAADTPSTASETNVTSPSFTPPANALLIVTAFGALAGAVSPDFTLANSAGLTFTRRMQAQGSAMGGSSTFAVWTAQTGASPAAMTVTRQSSAATIVGGVMAFAVTDDSGAVPTLPSGQIDDVTTTGTSMIATLASTPAAASLVLGFAATGPGLTGPTPGTGFTELAELQIDAAATDVVMQAQYDMTGADTTCDWSGMPATASVKLGIAMEVAEPVAAITGDGAVTLPAMTAAGTGVVSVEGAGAVTLPSLTASGAGVVSIEGAGTVTLPALTAAGTGTVEVAGTGAVTLPALSAAGTGVVAIEGTGAVTLPELIAAGSSTQTTTGEGAVTLPALVASGTGVVEVQAAGVVTMPALTAGGTATTLVQGAGNVSLPALTVAGTAVVAITGAGAVTLPMLVVVGSESITEPATSTGDVDLSVSGSELVELALSGTELVALSISGLPVVSFTLSSSLP